MSALDESELLMVQARLEVAGVIPETKTSPDAVEDRPLGIRRKPRPKPVLAQSPEAPAAPPPAPVEEHAPVAEAPPVVDAPITADVEAGAPPPERVDEVAVGAAPPAAPETELEIELPSVAADASREIETTAAEGSAPAAAEAGPEAAAPAPAAAPAAAPKLSEPRPTRLQPLRPSAKIVGRIDPSLLQSRPPAAAGPRPTTPSERETMTTSGAAVDVRPSFTHDRRKALQRTDAAARDRLSTAQLREKEQSRVRRLTGPQKGGLGQHASRGAGGAISPRPGAPASPGERGVVPIASPATIRALPEALGVKAGDLVKTMFLQFRRPLVQPNTLLTDEEAKLLAREHGFEIEVEAQATAEEEMRTERTAAEAAEKPEDLMARAPVIAFLGHVDHGKTSLIDSIRSTDVAAGEAGGITQHIGAYRIKTKSGAPITILDTPGHQAFTEMRKRGAQATDIVVLVVAADDGVMPQTEEAYAHAKAAGVQVIVALNKSDKASESQKERTVGQLAGLGLAPETRKGTSWGGHTAIIETSATKKTGIQELLERVALEAEMLDYRANPNRQADGIVLEAEK